MGWPEERDKESDGSRRMWPALARRDRPSGLSQPRPVGDTFAQSKTRPLLPSPQSHSTASMADPDQPTAASILSSLLLTPTAFLHTPTLASLRATLDSASAHLSAHTYDDALRLALKQVVRHRRRVVDEVEERIGRYKLVGKEARGKGPAGKVDGLDDDEDGLDDKVSGPDRLLQEPSWLCVAVPDSPSLTEWRRAC